MHAHTEGKLASVRRAGAHTRCLCKASPVSLCVTVPHGSALVQPYSKPELSAREPCKDPAPLAAALERPQPAGSSPDHLLTDILLGYGEWWGQGSFKTKLESPSKPLFLHKAEPPSPSFRTFQPHPTPPPHPSPGLRCTIWTFISN